MSSENGGHFLGLNRFRAKLEAHVSPHILWNDDRTPPDMNTRAFRTVVVVIVIRHSSCAVATTSSRTTQFLEFSRYAMPERISWQKIA